MWNDTKRTGDEGIDGIINEARLGLDSIYSSENMEGYCWRKSRH